MHVAALLSAMSVAFALALPASACSCSNPFPQGSEFLHLGEGDRISLPANALGVLFQRRLDLDVIDSDRQGNEILGTLPQRLEPEQFMIEDLTVRIPRQSGHQFHAKAATDSTANWPPIPRQSGHPFHGKAATDSTEIRPPFSGLVGGHEIA